MKMNIDGEIFRLNFENVLWIFFMFLSFLNILGDCDSKKFLISKEQIYKRHADYIFTLTLFITFFIYLYFFVRNYRQYQRIPCYLKDLYFVKVFGSIFLISGILCLLYFQQGQKHVI